MKKTNTNKGITLVSLVITIIVLLILAGITINLTIGERGIITRAQQSGKNYLEAQQYEEEQLNRLDKEFMNYLGEIENETQTSRYKIYKSNIIGGGNAINTCDLSSMVDYYKELTKDDIHIEIVAMSRPAVLPGVNLVKEYNPDTGILKWGYTEGGLNSSDVYSVYCSYRVIIIKE